MQFFAPLGLLVSSLVVCIAEPIAKPVAVPQELTNNAPFSGAVYIVNADGHQVTAQDGNWCPSSASLSCGKEGYPSWCVHHVLPCLLFTD
jgi:hypothetical protein